MMNATNTLTVIEVTDPSEISIESLKTVEEIQSYLDTVSTWCQSILSDVCRIENETEKGKGTDTNVYSVLQAYIDKLKLFISKIEKLEGSCFYKSIIQIDRQQFFTISASANLLKRGIYFALIRACWLAIDISKNSVKKCSIYYSCSEYFTGAIQIHRNVICKINNDIVDKSLLLAVYIKILKSILQTIEAKKKRKMVYQDELKLLQEIKKELLDDTSKQNLGVNKKFGGFLQTVESVLTKNRLTDKSEETNEDLDKLVREIQGNETLEKNGLQNNVRKKSKKKKRNKRANKKGDRETKDEMKPIKTADRFLTDLSKSIKQLSDNHKQIHINPDLCGFTLPKSFDVEKEKSLLQKRWEDVEKEAETNPDDVTIVNCGEQPSFTNK